LTLAHVAGRDDQSHEGIQNNPVPGAKFKPVDLAVDEQSIRNYVNAVGDERFWAFQASVLARHGVHLAPLTLFDREVAIRLVGVSAGYAMQAKQEFRFRAPLLVGEIYRVSGEVREVTKKREIGYFSTLATFAPLSDLSSIHLEAVNTRAYSFPDNQYSPARERPPVKVSDWLYSNGARLRALFPSVGAVVEGRTSLFDQARVNLYSGPDSNIHTDDAVARRGGLEGTVAQGIMATELECELYRDLFGIAYYRGGDMRTSYIHPIRCGMELRAICIVEEAGDDLLKLRSAVATSTGLVTSVGTASVRNWLTDGNVDK
jgi:acyl dehydratase